MKQDRIKITYGLLILYSIVLVHFIIFHQYDSEFLYSFFPNKENATKESKASLEIIPYGSHFNILSDCFEFSKKKFGVNNNNLNFSKNKKEPTPIKAFFPFIFAIVQLILYIKPINRRTINYSFFDSLYSKNLKLRAPPAFLK